MIKWILRQEQIETKKIKNTREEKVLHGQYALRSNDANVEKQKTRQRLKSTGLKAETVSFITATENYSLAVQSWHRRNTKIDMMIGQYMSALKCATCWEMV